MDIDYSKICAITPGYQVTEVTNIRNKFTLKGKKAFVTGAAGGIGRSTAKAFADLGADVTLMDIPAKEDYLKNLCEQIEKDFAVKAYYVTGDVSSQESVNRFIAEAAEKMGTIDICHSNAGIVLMDDCADVDIEKWNKVVAINLNGMLMVGRACANVMKKDGHGGSIINTASMSAHIINKDASGNYGFAYTTTKAAVLHLTKGMACEYIKYGIRVNSVSPGVVLSGIHDQVPVAFMEVAAQDIPIKRFGKLEEIAGTVAFMATDLASYMVGTDILIDGGTTLN